MGLVSRLQELYISLYIDDKKSRQIEDLQSCGTNVYCHALAFKISCKTIVLKRCFLDFLTAGRGLCAGMRQLRVIGEPYIIAIAQSSA